MTIGEIAKIAGVSKSAVSRYLNQGYISEDKKERIRQAIAETGYTPSKQAQQLRTGRTDLVGVVLPKINSESISRIVAGLSAVFNEKGYQILLANTENNIAKELEYLEVFRRDHVDGIILIGTELTKRHKETIQSMPAPVVVVGQQASYTSSIYHDDFGAARDICSLMLQSGRRAVGYLGVTDRDRAAGLARKEGYLSALRLAGITPLDDWRVEGEFSIESGYEKVKTLLDKAQVDSIFCATDFIAIGAMQYLKIIGKKIPEEISVAGIGHTQISGLISPKLTTVHYHYKTSGIEAAKLLIEQMENPDAVQKELKLGYRIVEQETTMPITDITKNWR